MSTPPSIALSSVKTADLVMAATEQVHAGRLQGEVLSELQSRWSRKDCSPEERAALVALDKTVFIPHFGRTQLPPDIIPMPGANGRSPTVTRVGKQMASHRRKSPEPRISFSDAVRHALTELLESKHLFQAVQVNVEQVLQKIPRKPRIPRQVTEVTRLALSALDGIPRQIAKLDNLQTELSFSRQWQLVDRDSAINDQGVCFILLPTIRVPCTHCTAVTPPHRARAPQSICIPSQQGRSGSEERLQIFALPYQCQNCLCEPVIFFVRRDGLKLKLIGRSQFEPIVVSRSFPKAVAEFVKQAVVAFKAGRCLAAIFYLRTAIEQHMRTTIKPVGRVSGEELADAYSKHLAVGFPAHLRSLKKLYQDLSVAMHEAHDDEALFVTSLAYMEKHFETFKILQR